MIKFPILFMMIIFFSFMNYLKQTNCRVNVKLRPPTTSLQTTLETYNFLLIYIPLSAIFCNFITNKIHKPPTYNTRCGQTIFPAVLYFVLRIRANSLSSMAHDQMLMAIAIMCTVRVRTVRHEKKGIIYAAAGKTQYT